MKWSTALSAIFTVLSLTQTANADPKFYLYQRAVLKQAIAAGLIEDSKAGPAKTFTQTIDHFAAADSPLKNKTFKQIYYVDSTYASNKNSPVFYYFCGEATCEGATSSALVNTEAKKYHGYRVALEHRYYGNSQPFATLTPDNLQYLSMDQAIEDLASFERYLQSSMGLKGKWISIGGSYSGELSAFYRLKHPELVAGALASSGPVLSKADFFEYDRHIAKVAPPACLAVIQSVVKDVEAKLQQTDSAAAVKALFHAQDVQDNVDFLYVIADMAAIAIQYGYQDQFCDALTQAKAGDQTGAYADAGYSLMSSVFGETPLEDSFQGAMSTDPKSYLSGSGVGARSWMYQSCTEFGYYQIANSDPAQSARSQQITLDYHNDACKRLFGLTTPVNTVNTNAKFFDHLAYPTTTRIFFTNGANDPWSNLGLTGQSPTALANPALSFFVIDGAAHCDDLGSRVSAALTSARDQFDVLVNTWLTTN